MENAGRMDNAGKSKNAGKMDNAGKTENAGMGERKEQRRCSLKGKMCTVKMDVAGKGKTVEQIRETEEQIQRC